MGSDLVGRDAEIAIATGLLARAAALDDLLSTVDLRILRELKTELKS